MKKIGRILRTIYWTITILALIFSVSIATYAWFTSNRTVTTDTATARSGTESLTLEISEQGGTSFSAVEEAAIVQINQTNAEYLLPVSTSNLENFVYNSSTIDSQAKEFFEVQNEDYYYHGRIFLRAAAEGMEEGTKLALYLDTAEEAGGAIAQTTSGELLTAARLGLMFDNDAQSSVIFQLEDTYNSSGNTGNTFVNDTQMAEGQVLSWNGSGVTEVADPSVTLDQYTIQMDGTSVTLPQQPLLYMEYNQIYQVDVYFYIEGCDPDCSEDISYDEADLHLAFYGIVSEEG